MKRDRPLIDPRWLCLLIVVLLMVFHWVNNWFYFRANVTLLGWDPTSHLGKTLIYNNILKEIDIRSLFQALTWPWNRPPLPWLPAVLLYRLFGVSTDVALMSNSFYIAVLLFSVYGIGKRLYGPGVGVLSAFLVSTYPLLFNLSRTLYTDFPLTAMVALNIYFLLRVDRFRDRLNSLFFGLAFGLGLLTKWQFLAFVAGPLAYLIVRSGAIEDLRSFRERRKGSSLLIRLLGSPWVHMGVGFILVTVWYLPNWDRVVRFLLGPWLLPLSWALVASTFYLLSRRESPGTNLLSALFLGTVVGSIWSLPNIGYLRRFSIVAYGGVNIEGREFTFLEPHAYTRYIHYLVFEQISPLYFFALLVAILISLYYWKGGSLREKLNRVRDNSWVLILWFVVPLLIFTFSLTKNARFDVALLPSAAIITAQGLFKVRKAIVKGMLVLALVIVGMVEFFALSYDGFEGVREKAILDLPLLGRLNLFAEGGFILLPASGPTDRAYWIAPSILDSIKGEMGPKGRAEFGVLISRRYLNAILLQYLIMSEERYAGIELRNLARGQEEPPIYPKVFECDYVVFKGGSYDGLNEDAREAMERLREGPAFFQEVFELAEEYPLPDGDTVYLYRKRYHLAGGYSPEDYRGIGEGIDSLASEEDGIIIVPPEQVEVLGKYIEERLEPYPLPREGASSEEMEKELNEILSRHGRISGVFWDEGGIEEVHSVEGWLNEHGYRTWERWYGGVRLVIYATSFGEEGVAYRPLRVRLGDKIILDGYGAIDEEVRAGDIVRLILHWRAEGEVEENYKVFIHLLDEEGRLVAQRDSGPVGGMRPTTRWETGEEIEDKYGILLPDDVPSGGHQLVVGMYEPESGERLPIVDEGGMVIGDKVSLGMVEVVDG